MSLVVHCVCGMTYRAEERLIGQTVTCECGRTLTIGRANPPTATLPTTRLTRAYVPIQRPTPARSRPVSRKAVLAVGAIIVAIFVISGLAYLRSNRSESVLSSYVADQNGEGQTSTQNHKLDAKPLAPAASLPNGTDIVKPARSKGWGTLRISNGTDFDAVVRLVDDASAETKRLLYIRANHGFRLDNVPSCLCRVQFMLGIDWDTTAYTFRRRESAQQFDDLFDFREKRSGSSIEFTNYEVTLHPVAYGNARTSQINW